jgi:hypothetical protein
MCTETGQWVDMEQHKLNPRGGNYCYCGESGGRYMLIKVIIITQKINESLMAVV